jgi:predicted XRE-type DNA-binding protein
MRYRDVAARLRKADSTPGLSAEGMVAMTEVLARAVRWRRGWELHIDGVGVTQCHTLADAVGMVRDYIATVRDLDDDAASRIEVRVVPDLGTAINERIEAARTAQAEADRVRDLAAARSRELVALLKADGLSGAEIARVLGISQQRVSQLLAS